MKGRTIYELLRADGSIVINKNLARTIGITEAIIYSELLSRYFYFEERGRIGADGYFYNTIGDLESGTTLTRRQQDPAIKRLVKLGLIQTKQAGIPAKRHFRITDNIDTLERLLDKGRLLPGQKWAKATPSIRSKWPDGEEADKQGVCALSDDMPDAIQESCQALVDSFKEHGAMRDISPGQVFEILAGEMAKQ